MSARGTVSAAAEMPMPRWAHVPGRTDGADHARLAPVKALITGSFTAGVPAEHPALRYGLALNDAGFFWECHEILEAVWAAAPQGGRDRLLLRACIQITNANLKQAMQRGAAAARLRDEAIALLDELRIRGAVEDGSFAGRFPAARLAETLRQTRCDPVTESRQPLRFGDLPSL